MRWPFAKSEAGVDVPEPFTEPERVQCPSLHISQIRDRPRFLRGDWGSYRDQLDRCEREAGHQGWHWVDDSAGFCLWTDLQAFKPDEAVR